MKLNWYVLYTRSRCEKKVAELLTKKGFSNYCPLNKVIRQWSDRYKMVQEPLFPSYVFVQCFPETLFQIKQVTSDIVNFVYWLGKPAIVKDDEISCIQQFLFQYSNVKLEKNHIHIHDQVSILNGPLKNREANVIAVEHNKVKLVIPSLGYRMVAETSISNIGPIGAYQEKKMAS